MVISKRQAAKLILDQDQPEPRPLNEIAAEISRTWHNIYSWAVPYLHGMSQLTTVDEMFGREDGRRIVRRFLDNAATWRSADGERIKAELERMISHDS